MAEKLHEVISAVIKKAGTPLKVSQIAKIIQDQQLWFKPSNGESPKQEQVSAMVNNYPHIFSRANGLVSLVAGTTENRLLRITYNKNLWELPSGHPWSRKNQGKPDYAFENMFGFGGEEWLFNNRYNIDGYQYGYIRGLWEVMNIDFIDTCYLFSIHPESKDRLLIAILRNVALLDPDALSKKVEKNFERYSPDMISELKEAGADYQRAKISDIRPIIRFKMEDATIFDEPIVANELKTGKKYNRFKPYKVEGDLETFLAALTIKKRTVFVPGKRKITLGGHTRTSEPRTKVIAGLHNEISDALERFLADEYSLKNKNISIETMTFGNNIVDFVLQRPDKTLVLLEIKTSSNVRYNIREALGQLLDYSNWDSTVNIRDLVIVSPGKLTGELLDFFERIRKSLKFNLSYWQYEKENSAKNKFIKY